MAFERQRAAAETAGEPFLTLAASRGFSDGESFPLLDTDLGVEDLTCRVALAPGQPALATITVSQTIESRSWQDYADDYCFALEDYMPCGGAATDVITTTHLALAWSSVAFDEVPKGRGLPVDLYLEIHRADGTGPRLVGGELKLTERIL